MARYGENKTLITYFALLSSIFYVQDLPENVTNERITTLLLPQPDNRSFHPGMVGYLLRDFPLTEEKVQTNKMAN